MDRWIDLRPFKAWCIQILPSIFDESMSYYEVLCKVIKILNNSLEDINILKGELENTNSVLDTFRGETQNQIDTFKEETQNKFDEFKAETQNKVDVFKAEVENQFEELVNGTWIQGTIPYLEELLKQYIPVAIFFEINNDGYFVANIPETWDEIQFNTTGYDYPEINSVGYGHLIMSY